MIIVKLRRVSRAWPLLLRTFHFQLIVRALPVDIPRGHGMSR